MYKHSLVKLLVLSVLLCGLLMGIGTVSANEPVTVEPRVVLGDGVVLDKEIITNFIETSVATDEVPSCPNYCGKMSCIFPVGDSYVLPANEPIRWWAGCDCVVPEGSSHEICNCPEESFCGRTREASEVGYFMNYSPNTYFKVHPVMVGRKDGVARLAIARFRLAGVSTEMIEKAVISFDGVQTNELEGCGDDAIFRVDLMSYATSYMWPKMGYWAYVQDYVVLSPIYEVTGRYLQAVTDEDGRVPVLGFRFSDEQVSGLEEAIARARTNSKWSLFVRWSLVNPPTEGDCALTFNQMLVTVIAK